MKFNPQKHHRRSIRLKNYNYSQLGYYFLTLCVQHRKCLFGKILNRSIHLNPIGNMIYTTWNEIPKNYPTIQIDEFIVMPNHFHAIVVLVGAGPRACPCPHKPQGQSQGVVPTTSSNLFGQPQGVAPTASSNLFVQPQGVAPTASQGMTLSDMVHRFKTMTTKRYVDGVKQHNWPEFQGKLWQRNYYERIVRNEMELRNIRQYILKNPLQWKLDSLFVEEE